MDPQKLAYFVSSYKSLGEEEIAEVTARFENLADEAAAALVQVSKERGLPTPGLKSGLGSSADNNDSTSPEKELRTKLSTDLWNSAISKRVQFQFSFMAIIFATSLLGSSGLKAGALWVVLLAAGLYYGANKIGRNYTRTVCADGDKTIIEKNESLRKTSAFLWLAMLVPAFLGVTLASVIRGV